MAGFLGEICSSVLIQVVLMVSVASVSTETSFARGKEFFVAFPIHNKDHLAYESVHTLLISNPNHNNVTVNVSFPKMTSLDDVTSTVLPDQTWRVVLNSSLELKDSGVQSKGVYINASDSVEVHALSDWSIIGMTHSKGTFLALPREALGEEYVIATNCMIHHCFCVIVVTEDDTNVTVSLRIPSLETVVFDGVSYSNNDTISVRGDVGDVIQITCFKCDMSGSLVRASRDVAVIAGSQFGRTGECSGADLAVEQFLPWAYAGHRYSLGFDVIFQGTCTDVVKIVTNDVNTQFVYDGVRYVSSVVRETFEFLRMKDRVTEIVANKKILVAQFSDPKENGDPVLFLPLPETSWATSYDFFVYGLDSAVTHLQLVGKEGVGVDLSADGAVVLSQNVTADNYTVVIMELDIGSSRVTLQCRNASSQCQPFYGVVVHQFSSKGWSLPLLPAMLNTISDAQDTETTSAVDTTLLVTSVETTSGTPSVETASGTTSVETTETGLQDATTELTKTSLYPLTSDGIVTSQTVTTQTDVSRHKTRNICPCSCGLSQKVGPTPDTEKIVTDLQRELVLDPENLSVSKRKRISAPDSRVSSVSMGVTAIAVMVVVFGVILCSDLLSVGKPRSRAKQKK
ncbi:hypothetical protein BaRGS_00014301, partial [Batillaria attramentaria]